MLGNAVGACEIPEQHRMLCAHRNGRYGVTYWNRQIERWLSEQTDMPLWSAWYVGARCWSPPTTTD